ncbi:MAG: electron transport complex subunit RsxC [Candidatus Omnitrophota bacterium]
MLKTFRGGVHPSYWKEDTASKPIRQVEEPKKVIIPLSQHTGAPARALVKAGDPVRIGQKLGEAEGFISATIHSSIAGKVAAIQPSPHPLGRNLPCVIIENDGSNLLDENVKPRGDIEHLSAEEIKEIVKEAGIVGMGGAAFPTHVKLSPPSQSKIDTFILNCAECEPYLTCDYRLVLERSADIIYGMKAMMKVLSLNSGFIGIEDNKPEAVKLLNRVIKKDSGIKIAVLNTKYPQGAEKQLIKAILSREVPSGGLPLDVGVVVNNAGTAFAVAQAVKLGIPLLKRVVTVCGGAVVEPQNLEVKLGTTFAEAIRQCGGSKDTLEKVIMGGPMMGIAQYTLEVPVIKGTSGILLLSREELIAEKTFACIKCARCVDSCPMNLLPVYLGIYGERELWDRCEELGALDCIECGCCAYVCPARIPLVQTVKSVKAELSASRRKK